MRFARVRLVAGASLGGSAQLDRTPDPIERSEALTMSASDDIWILGISMTKFGKHPDRDVVDLGAEAIMAALADAGVTMKDIGVFAAGNLMGRGGIAQQLQKQVGQTGIPAYNVSNACATGATALRTAIMAVKAGETDMGLACGVEKLAGAGLLGAGGQAKSDGHEWTPSGRYGAVAPVDGRIGTEAMPGVFAQVGMEYLHEHQYGGTAFELFAKISEKNHSHSTLNPLAAYSKAMSLEQIMNDIMIAYPNTRPMCSANCDGAAAAVVVSGEKLRTLSLEQQRRAVKVSASVLTSDPYEEACQVLPNVNTLTRNAAKQAYEQAGIGPDDLDLVELHDCFATAELVHYDNLMLCEEGGAVDFFESGAPWRDGRLPVNVSGGLQSKGHPISATGIANIWEVCQHVRGEGGPRQIEGAKVGLAHVIGLGSACGVHVLEKSGLAA
jgi:acetyl-CoA acetyltransferase